MGTLKNTDFLQDRTFGLAIVLAAPVFALGSLGAKKFRAFDEWPPFVSRIDATALIVNISVEPKKRVAAPCRHVGCQEEKPGMISMMPTANMRSFSESIGRQELRVSVNKARQEHLFLHLDILRIAVEAPEVF